MCDCPFPDNIIFHPEGQECISMGMFPAGVRFVEMSSFEIRK